MTLERARERGGICFIQYLEPMWLPTVSRDSQISQILWNKNIWSGVAPLIKWIKWHFNTQPLCHVNRVSHQPTGRLVKMEQCLHAHCTGWSCVPFSHIGRSFCNGFIPSCKVWQLSNSFYGSHCPCAVCSVHIFTRNFVESAAHGSLVWQIKRWIWDGDRAVT